MKWLFVFPLIFLSLNLLAQQPFEGKEAIVKSEFIYQSEDVKFPSCHASTIAETANGLIAAWFGGTHEKHPDVGIWVSRFENGKWTVPVEVANGIQHKTLRYPTWNPVLFNYGDEIMLFYKEGPSPGTWWGKYITSVDNGLTWSRPVRLPEGIAGPIKNKPELLPNGELICPSSSEDNGWRVHLEFTTDRGLTWERKEAVTLKKGKHVLVYNHIKPGEEWGSRNILNMAVSDDGTHWEAAILLENDPAKDKEYSYPAVIQTNDEKIHITYTWNRKLIKHVVVDPAKIAVKPMNKGVWPIN